MFLPSNHQRTVPLTKPPHPHYETSSAHIIGRRRRWWWWWWRRRWPQRVPCAMFILTLVISSSMELIVLPTLSLQLSPELQNSNQNDPQVQRRLLAADKIQLTDGSTTRVQSLEEYLSNGSLDLSGNSIKANTTTTTTTAAAAVASSDIQQLIPSNHEPDRSSEWTNSTIYNQQKLALKQQEHDSKINRQLEATAAAQHSPDLTGHQADHHRDPGDVQHNQANGHNHQNQSQASKPIPQHWQVKSLLNVTHDYPLAYSQIICGYVWPLMAAITLFTNLMIVFVLTQRDMRTPTNVVLTAIAIADIIPIVVPVPWFVYLFAMGNEKQVLYPPVACYFYQHSTRSISEIFYFLSTWLNVLLAIQDYLTACWPKMAKKYCQIRVVVVEIVCLTLLAFLLNLPQALKLVFKPVKFYYNGQLTWGCKALQAKWFKDLVGEYVALYDDIFTAIIVLFVDGGPAILLITLTALLIKQLQQQRIKGHLLMEQARTASKRRRERHRQQEYEASARVMIFVLLAFLAVKIPFATTYTLMIIQSRFDIRFVDNLVDFQKAITLTDLVFVLSYPINFTIFCCCSKRFRHKCAQLLGDCNDSTRTTRDRLWSSFSEQSNLNLTSIDEQPQSLSKSYRLLNQFNSIHQIQQPGCRNRDDSLATIESIDAGQRDKLDTIYQAAEGTDDMHGFETSQYNGSQQTNNDNQDDEGQQQQQQQQQAQSYKIPVVGSCTVKSILDDGSLCLECIMRYEQMRKHSNTGPSQLVNQDSIAQQSTSAGELQQPADQMSSRSSGDDGSQSSWLASGASGVCPRAPQLSNLPYIQHQLPSIITTRCESIRERDSSSADETIPSQCNAIQRQGHSNVANVDGTADDSSNTNTINNGKEERFRWDQEVVDNTRPNFGTSSASMNEAHTQLNSCRRAGHQRQHQQGQLVGGNLLGGPKRGHSANRVASDPGPSVTSADRVATARGGGGGDQDNQDNQDGQEAERRASGGYQPDHLSSSSSLAARLCRLGKQNIHDTNKATAGGGGQRKSKHKHHKEQHEEAVPKRGLGSLLLSQIESRQRSLSLSNSNLSTLPNATGLLADIFVSALVEVSAGSRSAPVGAPGGGSSARPNRQPPALDQRGDEMVELQGGQPSGEGGNQGAQFQTETRENQ